jgi:hypothetical protein
MLPGDTLEITWNLNRTHASGNSRVLISTIQGGDDDWRSDLIFPNPEEMEALQKNRMREKILSNIGQSKKARRVLECA